MLSEPAKPTGLTGLQGWPVRSAKKFQKTGFLSRPGMEPAKTGRTDWSGLGTQETQFKKKKPENSIFNSFCDFWDEVLGVWLD